MHLDFAVTAKKLQSNHHLFFLNFTHPISQMKLQLRTAKSMFGMFMI